MLAGRDRLHSFRTGTKATRVAGCSRAGIDYTRAASGTGPSQVAGCSRAGIDYTDRLHRVFASAVAGCSRAGIDYTHHRDAPRSRALRVARGPGSITLHPDSTRGGPGCGLLAGRDRLHCGRVLSVASVGCGLLAGRDRLHSRTRRVPSRARCGLLAGRDRLHFRRVAGFRAGGCGLLAGRDRLHWPVRWRVLVLVAGCSRAGIDYTQTPRRCQGKGVAGCSRAGIDYTVRAVRARGGRVAGCSRAGIDYTSAERTEYYDGLRVARGPGSITLARLPRAIRRSCGLLAGRDRLHYRRREAVGHRVAGCSRAGIDYTELEQPIDGLGLRVARGPGSITLLLECGMEATWLRVARGPGSITLRHGDS